MTKIGYIRSTKRNQNLLSQKKRLETFGCNTILVENHEFLQERRVLKKILHAIRPNDQLVVVDLDILAIDFNTTLKLMKYIYQREASLIALNMQSMSTNQGELSKLSNATIIEFYSYFQQPEKKMTQKKESTHVTNTGKGLAAGRKPKFETNDPLLQKAFAAYKMGEMNESEIERKLGINRQTFRRYRQKFGIERIDKK